MVLDVACAFFPQPSSELDDGFGTTSMRNIRSTATPRHRKNCGTVVGLVEDGGELNDWLGSLVK